MNTLTDQRRLRNRRGVPDLTALYRFYDEDDRLLYIGIAVEPFRRMAQHRHGKGWWADVARVDIERFDTRAAAATAERLAIVNEKPLYNIVHAERGAAETLAVTLWCAVCGQQVIGKAGYLCVDITSCSEIERRQRQAEAEHARTDTTWESINLEVYTASVPWTAYHAACDPAPDRDDYWIGAERITTVEELLNWNDHLLSKEWVARATDWTELLAIASRSTTSSLRIIKGRS